MLMLIHLIYTFINPKFKNSAKQFLNGFFNKKNVNTKYSKHDNSTWFGYYDIEDISEEFNPKNIFLKIKNLINKQ